MTVKEFYELMVEMSAEDYELRGYGDAGGGDYPLAKEDIEIFHPNKEVII